MEPVVENVEPTAERFPHLTAAYVAATRPPFILASVVPILLGLSFAFYRGYPLDGLTASLTLLAGILLHAAVNVLNDYYDALNGTDERNTERIYPFTGGSRFIQNGILTPSQMRNFGFGLVVAVTVIGAYLMAQSGAGLFWLGLGGLLLGWGYSAPPLRLNSRGLGELAVLAGFGLLPSGAFFVQTGQFSWLLLLVALPSALLTTNLLYINQFPDRKADIEAGKLHWVARLPPATAAWGYPLIALLAWGIFGLSIVSGVLPWPALVAALPAPLSLRAAGILIRHAEQSGALAPAIRMTILAMLGHGALLSMVFVLNRLFLH